MPGPVETILLLLAWGTGVALLLRRELHTALPVAASELRLRGLAVAILSCLFTAPVTFGISLATSERALPVRPPGPASGCSGDSSGGGTAIVMTAILMLVVVRLGPALIGYLVARRRAAATRGVPDGRLALRVGAVLFAGLAVLALVRILLGGVPDTAFTTYGAVTPPGATGRRVEAVIDRQRSDGQRHLLGPAPAIDTDVRSTHGHGMLSTGPIEVDGLKARIAGQAVNLIGGSGGQLLVQVVHRSGVDPARRPHWAAPPWWARSPGGDYHRLLVGPAEGGGRLAVRVAVRGVDVDAVGAQRSDVGLLLRPPVLPLVLGLFLAALAFALRARARSHALALAPRDAAWAGVCRVGAAALLLEASLLLYGAYRIYL